MSEIFISYDRADREIAARLAYVLEGYGFTVWWDANLLPGESFRATILEFIQQARATIVLWSADSVRSRFVIDEAQVAGEMDRLLPIDLDGSRPPLGFRGIQAQGLRAEDFRAGSGKLEGLLTSIEKLLGRNRLPFSELRAKRKFDTTGRPVDRSLEVAVQRWLTEFSGPFLSILAVFCLAVSLVFVLPGGPSAQARNALLFGEALKLLHIYAGMVIFGGGLVIILLFRIGARLPSADSRATSSMLARRLAYYVWAPTAIVQPLFGWGMIYASDMTSHRVVLADVSVRWLAVVLLVYAAALVLWAKGLAAAASATHSEVRLDNLLASESIAFKRDMYLWVGIVLIAVIFVLMVYHRFFEELFR